MKRKILTIIIILSMLFAISPVANAQNTENIVILKTTTNETLNETEESKFDGVNIAVIIGFLSGIIISFTVTSSMKNSMKTARKQKEAKNYIKEGSFFLKESYDRYLYQDTVQIKKEEKNNSSSVNGNANR